MSLLDPAKADEWKLRDLRDRAALVALQEVMRYALEAPDPEARDRMLKDAPAVAWAVAENFMGERGK